MKHRISVIVPCHNYGQYIGEAIASLDSQTRPPDEIVIINDGSSDNSESQISALADGRKDMIVLTRPTALGLVKAMADGVARSSGDIIVLLSADDRFSPRYLEETERRLQNPEVDFVWTGTHQFGAVERWKRPARSVSLKSMARRCNIHASAVVRRSVWEHVGGYSSDFEVLACEDWEFWVKALGAGFYGVPAGGCFLEWRRHQSNSRNQIPLRQVISVHKAIRRKHPSLVSGRDVVLGLGPTLGAFMLARIRPYVFRILRAF